MVSQQQLIDNLKKYYGLNVISVKAINRLMFRQSFLVNTEDDNRYVVKDYSDSYSLEELSTIWQYYWILHDNGMNVGRPLRRLDSATFHICLNNRYYVVFEYVAGERPNIENIRKIADCLREYHDIASKLNIDGLESTEKRLEPVKELFSYFHFGSYPLKEEIILCEPNVTRITQIYENNENTIIHGDTILENMVMNDDGICLIDYDTIRIGDRMEDVANTVLSILYNGSSNYAIHPERAMQVYSFIDNYYREKRSYQIENRIHYYIQVHCVIELVRFAENIRFLVRMPGMKDYILMLLKVLRSNSLVDLMKENKYV